MEDMDKEDYRKPSGDEGEVVFSQQEEETASTGPLGPRLDRQNENGWLEDTEPYHGGRPRMIDVNQHLQKSKSKKQKNPLISLFRYIDYVQSLNKFNDYIDVINVLGATMGTVGQDVDFRDTPAPMLPPEQQIRQEAEIQTPQRRDPLRDGSQRPEGPRLSMSGTALAPESFTDQDAEAAGRNRQSDEWSPVVALENTMLCMQRDLEDLQAENRFLRTPGPPAVAPLVRQAALTTTKVPWFNGSTSWEQYQQVFDAIELLNGWGDATAALQLLSHLQGDALNVALLIPMPRRASRKELTDRPVGSLRIAG